MEAKLMFSPTELSDDTMVPLAEEIVTLLPQQQPPQPVPRRFLGAAMTPMEASELTPARGSAPELPLVTCNYTYVAGCNNCQQAARRPVVSGKNNSSQDQHMKYVCPTMPEPPCDIGEPNQVEDRVAYRMALRPDRNKYVTINFRVMRFDAEIHVGQIVNMGGVKRSALYSPRILDRWTRTLRIKLKSVVKVSLVFKSISARLGLQSTVGLKYCLDGFYGCDTFGDAFGNFGTGICPWMEVTGDGTPQSLKLEDNDNIYISIATEKMLELARSRAQQISEQQHKQSQQRAKRMTRMSVQSLQFIGGGPPPPGDVFEMEQNAVL